MLVRRLRMLEVSSPSVDKFQVPVNTKKATSRLFIAKYFGIESELKSKIKRYVPSQGWSSLGHIFRNLAPSLSNILIESTLEELIQSIRECHTKDKLVCRKAWLDSSPSDPCMINEGKDRIFNNEEELCHAMLPFIPDRYVPLREVALQTPIDIFHELRESKFLFLTRFPTFFQVAHCREENTIVVKNLQSKKMSPCYKRYKIITDAVYAAAVCIPNKDAISETNCLYRIPRHYRSMIRNSGYTLSSIASTYPDLFELERDDEYSFSTGIRSKVSDPEKSHPENPPLSTKIVSRLLQRNSTRLEKLAERRDYGNFRTISTEEDFQQSALDILDGRAALKHSKRIGAVRDELIQNEILTNLPNDPEVGTDYDELLLKLSPKVRRHLAFEEGGLRTFIMDRKSLFNVTEKTNFTLIARTKHSHAEARKPMEGEKESTVSQQTKFPANNDFPEILSDKREENVVVGPTEDESESALLSPSEDNDVLSFDNIKNMKLPEKKSFIDDSLEEYEELEEEEDDLASEVARYVPKKGISGIAARDLALQIGKDMRRKIREEGYKTFDEFIHAFPQWFSIEKTEEGLFINVNPLEEEVDESTEQSDSHPCAPISSAESSCAILSQLHFQTPTEDRK